MKINTAALVAASAFSAMVPNAAEAAPAILSLNIAPGPGLSFGSCSSTIAAGSLCSLSSAQGTSGPFTLRFDTTGALYIDTGAFANGNTSLSFTSTGDAITGITPFFNGFTGFSAGNVTLSSGRLTVNFGGVSVASRGTVQVNLSTAPVAPVPEPATWAMMLVGFGMVAGAARYRRRTTATTFA